MLADFEFSITDLSGEEKSCSPDQPFVVENAGPADGGFVSLAQ